MHRIRCVSLALVLAAGSARAGIDNAGTTAGNFLSVGTGASVLAMGGATIAAGDDINAAAWNPAALARLGTMQFALSHAALAQVTAQDLAAAGGRVGRSATRWGASVLYQGDGSFEGRDALGVPTGSFNVSSMAVGVQVARPLGNAVTAGLGARWLGDNLGDASGTGLAFDAGLQARAGSLGLGVAARNVGGSLAYASGRFDLPAIYGVGASWNDDAKGLRLALDANFPSAYYNDVRIGGEWRWQDRVALRAGYRMELGAAIGEPLGGPSFGVGAGANGVWMDYAFLSGNADAQGQHRLGLTFHPSLLGGKSHPVASATARMPLVEVIVATQLGGRGAPAAVAPASDSLAAPQTAPATDVVPVPRALSMLEQLVVDVSDRLPPGGSESEAPPRELIPLHALVASLPVRVEPLNGMKPTGSFSDAETEDAPVATLPTVATHAPPKPAATRITVVKPTAARPVAARPPVAVPAPVRPPSIRPVGSTNPDAPVVLTRPAVAPTVGTQVTVIRRTGAPGAAAPVVTTHPIVAPSVAAPVTVAPPSVAPSVAAPVAVAPPTVAPSVAAPVVMTHPAVAPSVAAPVAVAPPSVAPSVAAPVAVAAPAVVKPAAVAPLVVSDVPADVPMVPVRAPRVEPVPRPAARLVPDAPVKTTPVAVPEPTAAPAVAPESTVPDSAPVPQPSAPAPAPAKPVQPSSWPRVSAVMPTVHYAGTVQRVAVVAVPSNAPPTEPITRPSGPRPASVSVKGDETLADIAKRWDTSVPALMMENNLVSSVVKGGQKLVLPPPLH